MTNKTYTLNDGTVLHEGQVLTTMTEAGPFIDLWNAANAKAGYEENPWSKLGEVNAYPVRYLCSGSLPIVINLLPEQADDNVIPPDDVVAWVNATDKNSAWYVCPFSGRWDKISSIGVHNVTTLEWLIAKGVTFYKQKPEGV